MGAVNITVGLLDPSCNCKKTMSTVGEWRERLRRDEEFACQLQKFEEDDGAVASVADGWEPPLRSKVRKVYVDCKNLECNCKNLECNCIL
jgi:hypothetical protein